MSSSSPTPAPSSSRLETILEKDEWDLSVTDKNYLYSNYLRSLDDWYTPDNLSLEDIIRVLKASMAKKLPPRRMLDERDRSPIRKDVEIEYERRRTPSPTKPKSTDTDMNWAANTPVKMS